jgi:hypothetical protein
MAAERPSTPGSDRAAPPRPPSRVEGAAVLGEDLSVAVSSVPEALLARQLLVHSPPPLALSQSTVLLAQAQCGFLFLHINTGLWKKISCQYSLGSLSCRSADDVSCVAGSRTLAPALSLALSFSHTLSLSRA